MELEITVESHILSQELSDKLNIMTLYIDSLQCPPEGFQTKDSSAFICATSGVWNSDNAIPVVFPNGVNRTPSDSDYIEKLRKWPATGNAHGQVEYIPGSEVDQSISPNEDGDFKCNEYFQHRSGGLHEKPKVSWNRERKFIFLPDSSTNCRNHISEHKFLPVEICKTKAISSGKEKKDDAPMCAFHGVAFVNCSPLLYPGVKKIRGAYRVVPFVEQEFEEKTNGMKSVMEEVISTRHRISVTTQPGNPKKQQTKKAAPSHEDHAEHGDKEGATQLTRQDTSLTENTADSPNPESHQYLEAQSYVIIEIELDRPLIPKRTIEAVDQNIRSHVLARKAPTTRQETAEKAVSEYHRQIAEVARFILLEFKKHELFYALNSSGKYFAFKERLKFAAIKIVREKFFQTETIPDQNHLQVFLRDLFVYLVDEMHLALRNVFVPRDYIAPSDQQQLSNELLERFAREAEDFGNPKIASKYYQERIARNPDVLFSWINFGIFYLGQKEFERAEVCFHRVLTVDQRHPTALVLYGLAAVMQERMEDATDFLEAAVMYDKLNPVTWMVLSLFYETVSNDIGAEMAMIEAQRADEQVDVFEAQRSFSHSTMKGPLSAVEDTSYQKHQQYPPDYAEEPSTALLLEKSIIGDGTVMEPTEGLSEVMSSERKQRSDSVQSLRSSAPGKKHGISPSRSMKSHKSSAVKPVSQTCPQPSDVQQPYQKSLYLKTAEFLLNCHLYSVVFIFDNVPIHRRTQEALFSGKHVMMYSPLYSSFFDPIEDVLSKFEQLASTALAHELVQHNQSLVSQSTKESGTHATIPTTDSAKADPSGAAANVNTEPQHHPTGSANQMPSWIKQRLINYHMKCARLFTHEDPADPSRIEKEVMHVLGLDPENADAWSLMGHLNYRSGDLLAARAHYERCWLLTTWPPNDQHVLCLRLGSIYLQEKEYQKAKELFIRACQNAPTALTWLGVGVACYRLDDLESAEEALAEANFLNNRDPKTWAYLSLVCLRTQRRAEAEQTYKYAIKMQLQEQALLEELHSLQAELGFGNPLALWEAELHCSV